MSGKPRRKENWPIILSEFLRSRADVPFQWGQNDCLLFCGECAYQLTDFDQRGEFLGNYDTREGAQEFIDSYGGVEGLLTAHFGLPSMEIFKAQRGDIIVFEFRGEQCAGIVDDSGKKIAALTEKGLTRLPISCGIMYWSV